MVDSLTDFTALEKAELVAAKWVVGAEAVAGVPLWATAATAERRMRAVEEAAVAAVALTFSAALTGIRVSSASVDKVEVMLPAAMVAAVVAGAAGIMEAVAAVRAREALAESVAAVAAAVVLRTSKPVRRM